MTAAAATTAAATTGFNVERRHACVRLLRTARAFVGAGATSSSSLGLHELLELAAAAGG